VGRALLPQHERLIARACERFSSDPELLGLIIGGSVAHGLASPQSDLDVMLVMPDEVVEERSRQDRLTIFDETMADYEGGYLDGKVIALGFIDEVAAHGSEPARWAFEDAFVAFSRVEELPERIAAAATYPEHECDEKLCDFVSHVMLMEWYMGEADKRLDRYLATFAGSRLALYAGRTALALNRMLYPVPQVVSLAAGACSQEARRPARTDRCSTNRSEHPYGARASFVHHRFRWARATDAGGCDALHASLGDELAQRKSTARRRLSAGSTTSSPARRVVRA